MKRHRSRQIALQILYQHDILAHASTELPVLGLPLIEELKYHFEYFQIPEELREFAAELVGGTLNHLTALDAVLEKHADHWKVSRMSSVDRSLLRMALYEMLYCKDSPRTIVINEAVELAKQYGTSETPAFINGILDNIEAPTLAAGA